RIGDRESMRMTLEPNWAGKRTGRRLRMQLIGDPWKLVVRGDIPSAGRTRVPEVRVELTGPTRHVGVARREREQTVEIAPHPATQPAAPHIPPIAHAR
ncbi:MAG: hypothetical protein ABIP55_12810, partial [Tepidisphaeraceae bacterium]